jgi:hypothetical protein
MAGQPTGWLVVRGVPIRLIKAFWATVSTGKEKHLLDKSEQLSPGWICALANPTDYAAQDGPRSTALSAKISENTRINRNP